MPCPTVPPEFSVAAVSVPMAMACLWPMEVQVSALNNSKIDRGKDMGAQQLRLHFIPGLWDLESTKWQLCTNGIPDLRGGWWPLSVCGRGLRGWWSQCPLPRYRGACTFPSSPCLPCALQHSRICLYATSQLWSLHPIDGLGPIPHPEPWNLGGCVHIFCLYICVLTVVFSQVWTWQPAFLAGSSWASFTHRRKYLDRNIRVHVHRVCARTWNNAHPIPHLMRGCE